MYVRILYTEFRKELHHTRKAGSFLMNWLHRFMSGRYGVADGLSIALIGIMLILSLLGMFTGWQILYLLSYIPLGLYLYRTFSRDIYRRQEENRKFMEFAGPFWRRLKQNGFHLREKWNHLRLRFRERKTHLFLKCPNCKQTLRLPRGKGRLKVTCPKCKTVFLKKT